MDAEWIFKILIFNDPRHPLEKCSVHMGKVSVPNGTKLRILLGQFESNAGGDAFRSLINKFS